MQSEETATFEICEPLKKDLPLFGELKLPPFKSRRGEKTFVGKVALADGSYVKAWVTATPALFWHFEVYCAENNRVHKVSTGSGGLSDYWKTVRMMAEGTLVVDESAERVN
jgi:hypothetical protein